MAKKITGSEHQLAKIFSSDFEYIIPAYQRPYAWTVDQAGELFDDLYDFYQTEADDSYFLGSIVLIKEEGAPKAEVIDGQQRLTTLTIFLSALTSLLGEGDRSDYHEYVLEPGRRSQGIAAKPRLTLRQRDARFFASYVQALKFDELAKKDPSSLENESQRNIQSNAALLQKKLLSSFEGDDEALLSFGRFLMTRCFLVVVTTPSQQSAFRVFSVLNNRGLDLLPTDIIKANAIGQIAEAQREQFNQRWEEIEVDLGRDGFSDLFSHIRMIYAKAKARKALLEEFKTFVLPKVSTSEALIETVIEPYAAGYLIARDSAFESTTNADEINFYFDWLNKIDSSDWLPVAISYLAKHSDDSDAVLNFVKGLERLAAYMQISGRNINQRIERYVAVLEEIETSSSTTIDSLALFEEEQLQFIDALNSNVYLMTARRRNYLILRLDSILSDGLATYQHKVLTIEHILPQTVNPNSDWDIQWPDSEQRKRWVHKLGNLVPLNRRRNAAASNYDFERKKTAYFRGRSDVSSFVLTTQVLKESVWKPETVERRQQDLISACCKHWSLG